MATIVTDLESPTEVESPTDSIYWFVYVESSNRRQRLRALQIEVAMYVSVLRENTSTDGQLCKKHSKYLYHRQ